jgi:hypothetical protein
VQHDPMLHVEQDRLGRAEGPDERVQGVAARHPLDQARVGREGDDGIPLGGEGGAEGVRRTSKHRWGGGWEPYTIPVGEERRGVIGKLRNIAAGHVGGGEERA